MALTSWENTVAIAAPLTSIQENHNQYDIQHNIGQAACHQKVKRALGIPDALRIPEPIL